MYVYRSNYLARSDHRNRKSVDAILGVIHEYRGDIHEYRGDIHLSCDIARYRAISRDIHEYRRDIVRYIFDEYRREYRLLTQITHFLYASPSCISLELLILFV